MKKILTIIGARPQFIKASVVSKAIQETDGLSEVLVHTGQHFDPNMSDIFFNQLGIPRPDYQLDINGGSHGDMTGRMLIEIEKVLLTEKPNLVLVYGDTNSTLAGALAAAKLHIPVAHVEAGLRSFNMKMPEEINRILTDQVSDMLFCPTQAAVDNLMTEGFATKNSQIFKVGDVMQDSALYFAENASFDFDKYPEVPKEGFILATIHRAENTDNLNNLTGIVNAINHAHEAIAPVVLPIHPRTQKIIKDENLHLKAHVIDPVGYFEMLFLLKSSNLVLTDSGGVQKEAFFFRKPCVTMREQTEWVELIENKANVLTGANTEKIISSILNMLDRKIEDPMKIYGGGHASREIVSYLQLNS